MKRITLSLLTVLAFAATVSVAQAHNHAEATTPSMTTAPSKAICDDKKGCKFCAKHAVSDTAEHAKHHDQASAMSIQTSANTQLGTSTNLASATGKSCAMSCCEDDHQCKTTCTKAEDDKKSATPNQPKADS